jgi:hypothetical protein
MSESILDNTKKILGMDATYTVFDTDIILHINSALSILNQLGIGPQLGFAIQDNTATWDQILGNDPSLNSVKTYVYLRVRLWFDPPATSYAIEAMKEQIRELEWRLNVRREETYWTDPEPELDPETGLPVVEDIIVVDGGFA